MILLPVQEMPLTLPKSQHKCDPTELIRFKYYSRNHRQPAGSWGSARPQSELPVLNQPLQTHRCPIHTCCFMLTPTTNYANGTKMLRVDNPVVGVTAPAHPHEIFTVAGGLCLSLSTIQEKIQNEMERLHYIWPISFVCQLNGCNRSISHFCLPQHGQHAIF